MGRGQRDDLTSDGPRRGARFIQAALVRANWRDLHALGHALVLIPEPAPIPSEPERVVLRCWRAHRELGAWEPDEELEVIRLPRPPGAR